MSFRKWKWLLLVSVFILAITGWMFLFANVLTELSIIKDTFKIILDKNVEDTKELGLDCLLDIYKTKLNAAYLLSLSRRITTQCVRVSIYDAYTGALVGESSIEGWSRMKDLTEVELKLILEGADISNDNCFIVPLYINPNGKYFCAQMCIRKDHYIYVFVLKPTLPIASFIRTTFGSKNYFYSLAFAIDDIYLYEGSGFQNTDLRLQLYRDHFTYYLLVDFHPLMPLVLFMLLPAFTFLIALRKLQHSCLYF